MFACRAVLQEVCSMLILPPLPDNNTPDEGREALQLMRRYHPLATVQEQAEQLMDLDDGTCRIVQGLRAVGLLQEQHGGDAIAALLDAPYDFYNE